MWRDYTVFLANTVSPQVNRYFVFKFCLVVHRSTTKTILPPLSQLSDVFFHFLRNEKISSNSLTCLQWPTAPWAHCVAVAPRSPLPHCGDSHLLGSWSPALVSLLSQCKASRGFMRKGTWNTTVWLQSATCWGITFWIRIHLLSEPKTPLCWVLVVKKSGANMIYDSWTFGQNLSVFCLSGNS